MPDGTLAAGGETSFTVSATMVTFGGTATAAGGTSTLSAA
jgi:hypothetical protein